MMFEPEVKKGKVDSTDTVFGTHENIFAGLTFPQAPTHDPVLDTVNTTEPDELKVSTTKLPVESPILPVYSLAPSKPRQVSYSVPVVSPSSSSASDSLGIAPQNFPVLKSPNTAPTVAPVESAQVLGSKTNSAIAVDASSVSTHANPVPVVTPSVHMTHSSSVAATKPKQVASGPLHGLSTTKASAPPVIASAPLVAPASTIASAPPLAHTIKPLTPSTSSSSATAAVHPPSFTQVRHSPLEDTSLSSGGRVAQSSVSVVSTAPVVNFPVSSAERMNWNPNQAAVPSTETTTAAGTQHAATATTKAPLTHKYVCCGGCRGWLTAPVEATYVHCPTCNSLNNCALVSTSNTSTHKSQRPRHQDGGTYVTWGQLVHRLAHMMERATTVLIGWTNSLLNWMDGQENQDEEGVAAVQLRLTRSYQNSTTLRKCCKIVNTCMKGVVNLVNCTTC